ncbi:recombinase family protein [Kineosporia succinea]|uniref:DNA invertase Pin-like site-specific DNA recombinase n=1 Tax=Kineosporia succinea TaxID=84632 RepID=A0ABT9NZI9_9ACTN|nr:recombinase family protein [Kineosporia succinea]MDP9825230.1 DNA invertase Pin-like site-specific DNA recombinase [Kineosporia succinea]
MRIGYARVSTREQNPEAQEDVLRAAGCDKVYIETISSKAVRRPIFEQAKDQLRAGDEFVVPRLDRMSRTVTEVLKLVDKFEKEDNGLIVLQFMGQPLNTRSASGRLMLTVFAAFAEFERNIMVERTLEGLAVARKHGRTGGRKPKMSMVKIKAAIEFYEQSDASWDQVADEFSISLSTLHTWRRKYEQKQLLAAA